jgi:hypothetical protein
MRRSSIEADGAISSKIGSTIIAPPGVMFWSACWEIELEPDDPDAHRRLPRGTTLCSRWLASSAALTPMNAPASTSAG